MQSFCHPMTSLHHTMKSNGLVECFGWDWFSIGQQLQGQCFQLCLLGTCVGLYFYWYFSTDWSSGCGLRMFCSLSAWSDLLSFHIHCLLTALCQRPHNIFPPDCISCLHTQHSTVPPQCSFHHIFPLPAFRRTCHPVSSLIHSVQLKQPSVERPQRKRPGC